MVRFNGIEIDPAAQTITHRGYTWVANRRVSVAFKAISMLILSGGMSREQMFWELYRDDPDGGPLAGPKILQIWMQQWTAKLARLQLEVRKTKIAGVTFYQLVPTHVFKDSKCLHCHPTNAPSC